MATVATLSIDLIGQSAKLRSELGRAGKSTKSWADKTRKQVNSVGRLVAGAGVAGAAALTAVYANAAKEADALAKTSDKLGIIPERLVGIQYAGELTGVALETTNKGLQNMVKTIGEASQGVGLGVRAFQSLNLSVADLEQMSPDQQFSAIAEAMKGLETQTQRVTVATQLFGARGAGLLNTLALGAEGLSAMQTEADELGITLDRIELAKIEQANDDFSRATQISSSFGKVLASEVAPLVSVVATGFVDSAKAAGGFGQVAQNVIQYTTSGIGIMADGLHGFKLLWLGVKAAAINYVTSGVRSIAYLDRAITHLLSNLNADVEVNATLQGMAESAKQSIKEAEDAFKASMLEEIPSEKIRSFVEDAHTKAHVAAQEVAAEKGSVMGQLLSIDDLQKIDTSGLEKLATIDDLTGIDIEGFRERNQLKEVEQKGHLKRLAAINFQGSKKAAAISKAAALTDATINGFKAIQGAVAAFPYFPYNLPAVALTTAEVAANIAGIRSAGSFEGGGFTGYGARVGGIDGRGGMPAILHPNETVIDHTRGSTVGNTQVSIQFSPTLLDASQIDEFLDGNRGKIVSLVRDAMDDKGQKGFS